MAELNDWTPVDDWVAPGASFKDRFDAANPPSTVADVAKSAGVGLARGVIGATGFAGDVAQLGGAAVDWASEKMMSPEQFQRYSELQKGKSNPLPTSADIVRKVEGVTGKFYEPQTTAGKYVGTAAEFAGNPLSYAGPGGVLAKAGTAVGAGLASEGAGQFAHENAPEWETAARVAGSIGGAIVPRAAIGRVGNAVARARTPTVDELSAAADRNYTNARGLGVEIHRAPINRLADDIAGDLQNNGRMPLDAPRTFNAVEQLRNPQGRYATIDDIDSVRRRLGNIRYEAQDRGERAAAARAIGGIDDYMATLHPSDVAVNPHFAGDVAREMTEARGNYAAMRRADMLAGRAEYAQDVAGAKGGDANFTNDLRRQMLAILAPTETGRKLRAGFADDEIAQMRTLVRGTTTGNLAGWVSRVGPRHPLIATILAAGAAAGGASAAGPAGAAIAAPLLMAGEAAHQIASASTRRQLDILDRMVRANSPLGQSRNIPQGPYVPPGWMALPAAGYVASEREPP